MITKLLSLLLFISLAFHLVLTIPLDGHGRHLTTTRTTTSPLTPLPATTPSKTTAPATTTFTSTSSVAIQSKTALADCNFQGMPSTVILEYMILSPYEPTVLGCQSACESTGGCESYSFRAPAGTGFGNCELYSLKFNGVDPVSGFALTIKSLVSGMWYSNRWPADGSGFCYGSG